MRRIILMICAVILGLVTSARASNWPDRRPIAFMEVTPWCEDIQARIKAGTLKTDKDINFAFMLHATQTLPILKDVNCQGVIFWDFSNEPDAMHYVGDPRILWPPLTLAAQKQIMGVYIAAGYKTGVCLRPGILVPRGDGTYNRLKAQTISEDLGGKIGFAQANFNCSIYYIDSYLDDEHGGAIAPNWFDGLGLDPSKILCICEYSAPSQGPTGWPIPFWTEADHYNRMSRWIGSTRYDAKGKLIPIPPVPCAGAYPGSFATYSMLDTVDTSRHDELVAAIKAGQIFLVRGWYDDGTHAWLKQLYRDAGVILGPSTQPTTAPTTAPTTQP